MAGRPNHQIGNWKIAPIELFDFRQHVGCVAAGLARQRFLVLLVQAVRIGDAGEVATV